MDIAFIILYDIWESDCHIKGGTTVEALVLRGISNVLGPSRVNFLPDIDRVVLNIISLVRENGVIVWSE